MARLWTCGFELQSVTAGVEFSSTTGTAPTISTTIHRDGLASMRIHPTTAESYVEQQLLTSATVERTFHRFYLYIASLPTSTTAIYAIGQSGFFPTYLRLSNTGTLRLYDANLSTDSGTASSALSTNTWYRIEIDHTDGGAGNGNVLAYIDGVNFSGTASMSGINGFSRVRMGVYSFTASADLYFDDWAINDISGSAQTSLPGAGSVVHMQPDAAGDNNAWSTSVVGGTAGAANNFTRINELTPDDATSYNATTVTGTTTIDDFNMESSTAAGIGASDTITLVQVGGRVGSSATTTASLVYRIKSQASGTLLESASVPVNVNGWQTHLATAGKTYQLTSYVDPQAGSAWTAALLDTTQIGYRTNVSQSSVRRVSTLWALVEFVPNTGVALSGADTGSGTEDLPVIGISGATESASGDGSHSIAATSNDSDVGSGAETTSIAAAVSDNDTASGLEDQTVGQPTTDSDSTSAGSESESLAVALSGTDTSSGADSEALTAALTDSDTGSGAEGTASIAFVDLETASGADVESILAAISGTDAVSGADTEDTVQGASDAESGGSSETFVLVAYVYESDGAEWTDTQISPNAQPPQIGDYPNTLVQGPAELFVATFPAVEPLDANVAFEPDSGVWTDLGSTLGGVELSIEQEFLSFELMQVPGTTFQRLKRRDMKIKMELAETTLANLAYALNESPTGQTFEPTQRSEADTLPYKALMIRGWAPGFTPEGRHLRRTVIIRKALSNDNVVTKFSKEDQTTYSVTWACHYVDENTRPFRIVEEV